MRDIRTDLQERLDAVAKDRAAMQSRLTLLDQTEIGIKALLQAEEQRFANFPILSQSIPFPDELDAGSTPLAKFLLQTLRSAGTALPLEDIKAAAETSNIDFEGKSPGRVIHYALVGMTQNGSVEKVGERWQIKEAL